MVEQASHYQIGQLQLQQEAQMPMLAVAVVVVAVCQFRQVVSVVVEQVLEGINQTQLQGKQTLVAVVVLVSMKAHLQQVVLELSLLDTRSKE
jgi:hypothetical protein